jgi:outer membrane protein insertion porin family
VRHINFTRLTGINDDVMRREMRQMEGGYLSNSVVERSKQRPQRLPFIEKVEVETEPVAGTRTSSTSTTPSRKACVSSRRHRRLES